MNQTRQGQHSTKQSKPAAASPSADTSSDFSHSFFARTLPVTELAHADATGRFPFTSRTGTKYVLVIVWGNYIHLEPLPDRSAAAYVAAYRRAFAYFATCGHSTPSDLRMDNETSSALQTLFSEAQISAQFVPPGVHRANKGERAIQDAKNHLVSMIATAHLSFPLDLWDQLLPHAELTLNHLRPFGPDPNISAYRGFHGKPYDFLAHPIAPAGTLVVAHDKPHQRPSWGPHGSPGYYLGPAITTYRSWRVWIIKTATERVTDTVAWFPAPLVLPGASYAEGLTAALLDLNTALSRLKTDTNVPPLQADRLSYLLSELAAIYQTPVPAATEQRVLSTIPTVHSPAPLPTPPPLPTQATPPPAIIDTPILPPPPHPVLPTPAPAAAQRVPSTRKDNARAQVSDLLSRAPFNPARPRQPRGNPVASANAVTASASPLPPTAADISVFNLDADGKPLTWRTAQSGPDRVHWLEADNVEFRRLFDTSSWHAIQPQDQPFDRRKDTTYYNKVVKAKLKDGQKHYRVRGTLGGDRIDYPFSVAARTADLEIVKTLVQSVMADDAHWMTIDITDFYLNTPLPRPEYVRIPLRQIPATILDEFKLHDFVHNDSVLFEVNKTMYGLPQAGKLAQDALILHLSEHGYLQDSIVAGLFKHATNGTVFTLVVDDFGIKYLTRDGADHLIAALQTKYKITIDWTGQKYLGMDIEFDRTKDTVTLSMSGYIAKALARFKHVCARPTPSPMVYVPPSYGKTQSQFVLPSAAPALNAKQTEYCQQVIGTLLYYARAIDLTMLPAVNAIASELAHATTHILDHLQRLLDYAATYSENKLVYHRSNMILIIHSDASYLSRSRARSVVGGIGFLGDTSNGAIFAQSVVLDVVVASAAEAEYGGLFLNCQAGVNSRRILDVLGHAQPPTVVTSDNKCAVGLANDTLKVRRSKTIDMRFHWTRDRIRQQQFQVVWAPGKVNLADFFTKALPVHIHQARMHQLVQVPNPHLFPRHTRFSPNRQ